MSVRTVGPATAAVDAVRRSEASTGRHSFIVRLWQDDEPSESSRAPWRGHVTHVPDGQPVYARRPDDVPTLLACEIDHRGIRLGWSWRLRITIHEWKSNWRKRK